MTSYVLTLLAASLAAAMVELIAPKGEGGRLANHVRMIAGLFLLVTLLNPLREGLAILQAAAEGDLPRRLEAKINAATPEDHEATFVASLAAMGQAETESWVTETLQTRFSIPPTDCAVEVLCDALCDAETQTLTLRELRIGLKGGSALQNPHPIEAYFSEALNCPCYVVVTAD